jgi:uncharacterized protein
MALRFEWDRKKAAENIKKHGVSFEEAASCFGDGLSISVADPDHSEREQRWLLVGVSSIDRLLVVAHTDRGGNIRIISARLATSRERKNHEKG